MGGDQAGSKEGFLVCYSFSMFGVPKIFRAPNQESGGINRQKESSDAHDLFEAVVRRFREDDPATFMTTEEAVSLLTHVAPDTVLPFIDNEIGEGRLKLNQELQMLIDSARLREAA